MINKLTEFEKENSKKLKQFLAEYNPGHDDTQIVHFVIARNGVTTFGMYRQALAEINSHYNSLRESYFLQKKLYKESEILDAEAEELDSQATGSPKVNKLQADLKRLESQNKSTSASAIQKSIERSYNELTKLFAMACNFEKKIDRKNLKKLEREFWVEKLAKDVVFNTQYNGGNLSGIVETISSLPEDMQLEIMDPKRRQKHLLPNDRKQLK